MTGAALSNILEAFALLGVFLLLGTLLRARLRFLQKMFIPASVIGGFIGLLIGPSIWGGATPVRYPADWIQLYALLPGVLIIPVVASVPLGIQLAGDQSSSDTTRNIFNMFFLMAGLFGLQFLIGGAIGAAFQSASPDLGIYNTFGMEMTMGFSGGHGTAGVVGNMLEGMGLEYWEIAQGVTVTYATIGLIGGILAGIALIRRISERHGFANITSAEELPPSWLTGVQPNAAERRPAGHETTVSTSIDVFCFNLALILAGSGLAILVRRLINQLGVPVISVVPVWAYAIIVMWLVWLVMTKLGIDWLVDHGVKSKIASTLTDFAIVAAIVSMPVQAVMTFITPIVITAVVGFLATVASIYLCKYLFSSALYERWLLIFGTATGVFLTGLLLLKIADPELDTPAMRDGSLAYSMNTVFGFVLLPVVAGAAAASGPMAIALIGLAVVVGCVIGVLVFNRLGGTAPAGQGQKG